MLRMGPSDLFRGFWASSLRDAPYAGLFVVFYETIKVQAGQLSRILPPHCILTHSPTAAISSLSGSMTQSAFIHSASGALAGAMATISTHPFDVIKVCPNLAFRDIFQLLVQTKVQVRQEERYMGLRNAAVTIWKVTFFTILRMRRFTNLGSLSNVGRSDFSMVCPSVCLGKCWARPSDGARMKDF